MQIIRLADRSPVKPPPAACVALGFFDGIHRAHAAVLAAAAREAKACALPLLIYTFRAADAPKGNALHLSEEDERLALLAAAGAELCALCDFSATRDVGAEDFVRDVLLSDLHAAVTVVGADFRFGRGACGDAALLARLMQEGGGRALTVPDISEDGAPISSTRIRAALAAGDVRTAEALLGRPYTLTYPVVRGAALGRQLGFPTANQIPPPYRALPADGVYVSEVITPDGVRRRGVSDVGKRPTVGGVERRVETYILDYEGDLYGAPLTVAFLARLRGEVSYPDLAALSAAIRKDIEEARQWK